MGTLLSVLGVVVLLGTGYVLLKVLTNYFGRSPLDNIPGPPCGDWMEGKHGPNALSTHSEYSSQNREFLAIVLPYRMGLLFASES